MRDVTQDMRDQDFQRALRQHAQLLKGMSDAKRALALQMSPTMEQAYMDGFAEGLLIAAEALAGASEWDSPDRPRLETVRQPIGRDL